MKFSLAPIAFLLFLLFGCDSMEDIQDRSQHIVSGN